MLDKHHLAAERVGAFVSRTRIVGPVVSVHSRAINLRCHDGLLVSIVEDLSQMTSLSISAPMLFQTLRGHPPSILPGDGVVIRNDSLLLDGVCLDLKGVKGWQGIIHSSHIRGFSLNRLPLIKEALLEVGRTGGLLRLVGGHGDWSPFALRAAGRLKEMPLEGPDPPRFRRLSQLIGLGPGFTPSGDDFIAGALAGERMSQIFGQPGFAIDKGELRTSLCKTNDAGKTLLWQALQGHFPCYLTEAVKGLSRAGGPHDLARVVSRATVHGETSGTDALAGLLWYLDACSSKMEGLHG